MTDEKKISTRCKRCGIYPKSEWVTEHVGHEADRMWWYEIKCMRCYKTVRVDGGNGGKDDAEKKWNQENKN